MYLLKICLILIFSWLTSLNVRAQNNAIFNGGAAGGYASVAFQQTENNAIFSGAAADGYATVAFQQTENNAIFNGGAADGYATVAFQQTENNAIFNGGAADGYATVAFQQTENNAIFNGGAADGYATVAFQQTENNAIFNGGAADGYASVAFQQMENNAIFSGGAADGYASVAFQQTENNAIFNGGAADGYASLAFLQQEVFPIELVHFSAMPDGNFVLLRWQTASETNNHFFTIEKTVDAFVFEEVAKVYGAGFSNSEINYESLDRFPFYGLSYYRLKQTDFDGSHTYSALKAVEFSGNGSWNFIILSNPGDGSELNLFFTGTDFCNDLIITLRDMKGRIIHKEPIEGGHSTSFLHACSLSKDLESGSYILSADCGNSKLLSKMVIVQSPK